MAHMNSSVGLPVCLGLISVCFAYFSSLTPGCLYTFLCFRILCFSMSIFSWLTLVVVFGALNFLESLVSNVNYL